MALYRQEAVVLRTYKLGEADRIVVLYTRSRGKVRAVAKGVRRTRSKFGARLEPGSVVHLQLYEGRNLDIAKRFGIKKVKTTPLVMLVSADGKLLNSKKDAASWRNAASRGEDDIYSYFARFTPA